VQIREAELVKAVGDERERSLCRANHVLTTVARAHTDSVRRPDWNDRINHFPRNRKRFSCYRRTGLSGDWSWIGESVDQVAVGTVNLHASTEAALAALLPA